jgi:pyruvate kinase
MLIAKIEKFDAVENIDTILEASDGLMVARGDLGIEVPYYEVPTIQKMLIQKANAQGKPVITATQMLLSMTHSPRATRAEISDVANAVLDGTDAVMLSEESAMGDYPLLSVQTMTQTILEAEKHYPYYQFPPVDYQDVTDAIDEAAVRLGKEVGAAGIISLTSSGKSAKKLSKYRPHIPIFAITHEETIRRQLTLSWGIEPLTSLPKEPLEPFIHTIIQRGVQEGSFLLDQQYVLTSGHRTGVSDSINTIELLRKGEMLAFNAPYHP